MVYALFYFARCALNVYVIVADDFAIFSPTDFFDAFFVSAVCARVLRFLNAIEKDICSLIQ